MISNNGAMKAACAFMILLFSAGGVASAAGEAIHVPRDSEAIASSSRRADGPMVGLLAMDVTERSKVIASLPIGETAKGWLRALPAPISEIFVADNGKLEALDRVTRNQTLLRRHGGLLFDMLRVDTFSQNTEKMLKSIAALGHCSGLQNCLKTLALQPINSVRYKGGEAELHVLAQLAREGRLVSLPTTLFRAGPLRNRAFTPYGTLFEVDGFIRDENDYQFLEIKAVGYDAGHVEKNLAKALRNASLLGMSGLLVFSLIDREAIDKHLVSLRSFIEKKLGSSSPLRVAYFHHPRGQVNQESARRQIKLLYEPEEVVIPTVTGTLANNPPVRALLMLKQSKMRAPGLSRKMRLALWAEEKTLFSKAPKMGKGR